MELNWNQWCSDKKTKLNICHHMLTLFTQLQNRSFHVMERRERLRNIQKWKMHSVQNYCFSLSNMQICDVLAVVVFRVLAWARNYKTDKSNQLLLSEVCGMFVSSCCRGFNVYGQSDITQLVYWIAHWFHRNARMVRRSPHSGAKYSRQSFPFLCHAQGRKIRTSTPAREKCGSFCYNWDSSRRKRCLQLPFNRGRPLCFCFAGAILSQLLLKGNQERQVEIVVSDASKVILREGFK